MKKYAVMSGKGGVGKSSLTSLISIMLSEYGDTLVLDFDLCGPSIGNALSCHGTVTKGENGLVPLKAMDNLSVLSMSSLVKPTDSIIWRGPRKLSMLSMFYGSIDGFDYVVMDTPPGISEEHSFLPDKDISVIIVTSPQNVSLCDAAKAINFCKNFNLNIVGVVENMSGYKCECCGKTTNVFGSKGAAALASEYDVPFLCSLPIEPFVSELMDNGALVKRYKELATYNKLLKALVGLIV